MKLTIDLLLETIVDADELTDSEKEFLLLNLRKVSDAYEKKYGKPVEIDI